MDYDQVLPVRGSETK